MANAMTTNRASRPVIVALAHAGGQRSLVIPIRWPDLERDGHESHLRREDNSAPVPVVRPRRKLTRF